MSIEIIYGYIVQATVNNYYDEFYSPSKGGGKKRTPGDLKH